MNHEEIDLFLQPLIKVYFNHKECLFIWYYTKTQNYIDGIYAVVEALNEQPQIDYIIKTLFNKDCLYNCNGTYIRSYWLDFN